MREVSGSAIMERKDEKEQAVESPEKAPTAKKAIKWKKTRSGQAEVVGPKGPGRMFSAAPKNKKITQQKREADRETSLANRGTTWWQSRHKAGRV